MRHAQAKDLIYQRVKYIANSMIGEPNTIETRKKLTAAIYNDVLIQRYDYKFTVTESATIPGRIDINV